MRQRGEGVAIVLTGPAVNAWREGRVWKAWSSRLRTLVTGRSSGDRLHQPRCHVMLCPNICIKQAGQR